MQERVVQKWGEYSASKGQRWQQCDIVYGRIQKTSSISSTSFRFYSSRASFSGAQVTAFGQAVMTAFNKQLEHRHSAKQI
jgi:hypothetical protein